MVKPLHCLIGIVLFLAVLNAGNGFTLDRSASIERQEDSWPKISLFHGNQRKKRSEEKRFSDMEQTK
uniref:U-scoloptoxin(24)-Er2a n=1 Tax=Ethmostigmus rubripes TaxID=62613 RepID=TXO2A_ETHRU|nr:RecName: Full=U-scoloptoxin(24)-Er2a; Short=U-SLPTX(24)-Er2a; Flags: Precursor [Ethmostigmus rubripes]